MVTATNDVLERGIVAQTTGTFTGVRNLKIFYRLWTPAEGLDTAKASLILVHGAAEHSGRYEHFGTRYAQKKGYAVWALDLPGLGQSEGLRGHIDDFDDYLDDVGLLLRMVRTQMPAKMVFLVGFSLGGLIVLNYAEKYGWTVDGAAVSGPLLGLKLKVPPLKTAMAQVLANVAPKMALENEIDPALLAHNPEVGRAYVEDPLLCTKVSLRWFAELNRAMATTKAQVATLDNLPLLLLQGTEDGIVDLEETRAFAAAGREYVEFPGLYHELFNEDERGRAFAVLDAWLEKLIGRG